MRCNAAYCFELHFCSSEKNSTAYSGIMSSGKRGPRSGARGRNSDEEERR